MNDSQKVKFYGDAPDGLTKNKYMVYNVTDIDHALKLLNRMSKNGWIIRAAYYQNITGLSVKLTQEMIKLYKDW